MRRSFDIRVGNPRLDGADVNPVVIVSADSHAGPPAAEYVEYLDPKYRQYADQYLEDMATLNGITSFVGYPFPPDVLDVIDTRRSIETGGETGYFDPERRLREAEAEGVVAEFLHPAGPIGSAPFFDSLSRPYSPELRAAGARAHNRFLTEFAQAAPGRLLPVPCMYPWPDVDAMVRACEEAAKSGAKAVFAPQQAGVRNDHCPAFYDPSWDPFWAACAHHNLVVHVHAGTGQAQGEVTTRLQEIVARAQAAQSQASGSDKDLETTISEVFETFVERRPLWQLMWGGVFDRHPGLRVAFIEIHADWVPPTLAYLDQRFAQGGTPLRMKPSEYWHLHCAVGGSLMRFSDVNVRHEIGVDRLMFGTDFPHMEGSWPNTWDWIRTVFADVPEHEARQLLGENAIDFYGLDRELLTRTARRIGPFPEDILGPNHAVDPAILRNFHQRGGIGKERSYDERQLADAVDEDERGAALARI